MYSVMYGGTLFATGWPRCYGRPDTYIRQHAVFFALLQSRLVYIRLRSDGDYLTLQFFLFLFPPPAMAEY